MLGKVLKYDLKAIGKTIIPIFLIVLCFSIVTRLIGILASYVTIFTILEIITNVILIIAILVMFVAIFYIAVKRFYDNMLKDEGYLTHTLPVKKSILVLSKVLAAIIYLAIRNNSIANLSYYSILYRWNISNSN